MQLQQSPNHLQTQCKNDIFSPLLTLSRIQKPFQISGDPILSEHLLIHSSMGSKTIQELSTGIVLL